MDPTDDEGPEDMGSFHFDDPPTERIALQPALRAAARRSRPPPASRKATMLSAVALADRRPRRARGKRASQKATLIMGSIPEPHPDERPTTEMRVVEGPRLNHTWFDGAQVGAVSAPVVPVARPRSRRRRAHVVEVIVLPSRLPRLWAWIALGLGGLAFVALLLTLVR